MTLVPIDFSHKLALHLEAKEMLYEDRGKAEAVIRDFIAHKWKPTGPLAPEAWKLKYELAEWSLKEHYNTICNMQMFVDYYTASEECLRVELHNTKAHVTHLRKLEWRYMNEMFGLKQALAGLNEKLIISEAQRAAGEIALKTALDQVEKLQEGATVTPAFNKTILGTWQITPPSSPVKIHFPSPASDVEDSKAD